MKEADGQRAILDYLSMRRHFFFRCCNTSAYKIQHGSFIRDSRGAPDIGLCVEGSSPAWR
jgi:hypothetical protein